MSLIFQYGSNMSINRLNSEQRLAGAAVSLGVVKTEGKFELDFTFYSKSNNCGAADLVETSRGRQIYGLLYEIPDEYIYRHKKTKNIKKCLDQIEGEGNSYKRVTINIIKESEEPISAQTYLVIDKKYDLKTSLEYVSHILTGISENKINGDYKEYVISRIRANNPSLDVGKLRSIGNV